MQGDLESIGLTPQRVFRFVAERRNINLEIAEKNGLAAELSRTEYVERWMAETGRLDGFNMHPVLMTRSVLYTDHQEGLLADLVAADQMDADVAEAYLIFERAGTTTTDDIVGQINISPVLGISSSIQDLREVTELLYPSMSDEEVDRFVRIVLLDELVNTETGVDVLGENLNRRVDSLFESLGVDLDQILGESHSREKQLLEISDSGTMLSRVDGQPYWDPNGDGDLSDAFWLNPTGPDGLNFRGRTVEQEVIAWSHWDNFWNALGVPTKNSPGAANPNPTTPTLPKSPNSGGSGDPKSPKPKSPKKPVDLDDLPVNDLKPIVTQGGPKVKPVLLDLDGTGIGITQLSNSTVFVDANDDGLQNNVAWAAAGTGVLFYDADGDGVISSTREFVFTGWDPTATSDLAAIASVFDVDNNGILEGDELNGFLVMVTNADGSMTAQSLSDLDITSIDLNPDATHIELPDGSVITAQSTFTYSDGSTGTIGDVALAYDNRSYRVEVVESTNGAGDAVVTTTGFEADGSIAFVIEAVTEADVGLGRITNSYDDNGDGTFDRVQVISNALLGGGEIREIVDDYIGASTATGIRTDRTVTVNDVPDNEVRIFRYEGEASWYHQTETRSTHADGSMTITIKNWSEGGTVLTYSVSEVSADGLTRTESLYLDGDTVADQVTSFVITVAPNGDRTETTTVLNPDGTERSVQSELIVTNGTTQTTQTDVSTDLDGDGTFETLQSSTITIAPDGSSTSTVTVTNADGTPRSVTTYEQSADALSTTVTGDVNGDTIIDSTTVDAVVIHGDGSRDHTVTVTNTDGSIRSMVLETLGADQVSSEAWVDLNQNGTFETTDIVQSVSVDAITGDLTATSWDRNADGSINSQTVTVTSFDGLTSTTQIDLDGDGDWDITRDDVTVLNGDGSATQTITTTNLDGSPRDETVILSSADGLSSTVTSDIDGDGDPDGVTTTVRTVNADDSVTTVVSDFAGDGTTPLSIVTTVESDDRRDVTVSTDSDGDGAIDLEVYSEEATDGTTTTTTTAYFDDGDVASQTIETISGDGLSWSSSVDADGDSYDEATTSGQVLLNADGSRTETVTVQNGDGTLRSETVTTTSDDGFTVTVEQDADGDGVFELTETSVTSFGLDGSTTTLVTSSASDGTVLGRVETEVSDDGLTVTTSTDTDGETDIGGNFTFDLIQTSVTTLLTDGGVQEVVELRDDAGTLRSRVTTVTSDDGRVRTVSADLDGDGAIDQVETHVEADDGTVTTTVSEYNSDGVLTPRSQTVTDGTGLYSETRTDADGDGVFEQVIHSTTTLNNDGSKTVVTEDKSADGTANGSSIVFTSADGLTTTTSTDLDGDGSIFEFVTTQTTSLAADGTETVSSETRSEDGGSISTYEQVTTADGNTLTQSSDRDGNGNPDEITVTSVAADGSTTSISTYYSEGGGIEGVLTQVTSGTGLEVVSELDSNGDGRAELLTFEQTSLGFDGSVTTTVEYLNDHYELLGLEEHFVDDDGLSGRTSFDFDGDGLWDTISQWETATLANGQTITQIQTLDGTYAVVAEETIIQVGDGLGEVVQSDFDGDGALDRIVTMSAGPSGGSTTFTQEFGSGAILASTTLHTVSEDGLTEQVSIDRDGDGHIDQSYTVEIGADQSVTTTYVDLDELGLVQNEVVETVSATGLEVVSTYDVDGDGTVDFVRSQVTEFDSDGTQTITYEETAADDALIYQHVSTVDANGLGSAGSYDVDGDGISDGTQTTAMSYNPDGSQSQTSETFYADGELRSSTSSEISADGMTTSSEADYDGNGIIDQSSETEVRSDGTVVETVHSYNEAGYLNSTFITTTSADGLTVQTDRGDRTETITYSPAGDGSYTWDNGAEEDTPSGHITSSQHFDANGVVTWMFTKVTSAGTDTYEEQLDADALATVLVEAARLYDTVLDRGMDSVEREGLVKFISDGQLDEAALVDELLGGDEVSTRYGSGTTNAEFVTQLYLNSFGRAPSMNELASSLAALNGDPDPWTGLHGPATRAEIAIEIAHSSEHVLVGNGHMMTNNFDVIRNPAQFERFLDRAYVEALVVNLVDVAYDRAATAREIEILTGQLLEGTQTLEEIADQLLDYSGRAPGVSVNPLAGLAGESLVEEAYLNALGREPTQAELQIWADLLGSGQISTSQFVASLAQSSEHAAYGNQYDTNSAPSETTVLGGTGGDTLNGTQGVNIIIGGEGADQLEGNGGADMYVWTTGDGNDVIDDDSNRLIVSDVLVLTDVVHTDVTITRASGSDNLTVTVNTGEIITIKDAFDDVDTGYGIEEIRFADGVVWTHEEIVDQVAVNGTSGNDNLNGIGGFDDIIYGGDGNDSLWANNGDEIMEGGLGDDTLDAGVGHDTYVWSLGDGNDTIEETGTSLAEIDRLVIHGVSAEHVSLTRDPTHLADLIVTIDVPGTPAETLTLIDQFSGTGAGIELITFDDGTSWGIADILLGSELIGTTPTGDTIDGTSLNDVFVGDVGGDRLQDITYGGGDDTFHGGLGDDTLFGAEGSDVYFWSAGDGNDEIRDHGDAFIDTDRLVLQGVGSDDVSLTRNQGNDDLLIEIISTGEVIRVDKQLNTIHDSNGIEVIEFGDGVVWTIEDILAATAVNGTSGNDSLTHESWDDANFYGGAGDDTISAGGGDDLLVGGLDDDTLKGAGGSDLYLWSDGDGSDIIDDTGDSLEDVDVVEFTDVASDEIDLSKSGDDLLVSILGSNQVLTIVDRFESSNVGDGVELLAMSDGVMIEVLAQSAAQTIVTGTAANESLGGWGFIDNLYGEAGNDTLNGGGGNDTLVGGEDVDTLRGDDGSDTYLWATGDGNDYIDDNGDSFSEIDRLVLEDVASTEVTLSRENGSDDLIISINGGTEVIVDKERFGNTAYGDGLEEIVFSDGVVWTLEDILANTIVHGSEQGDTLTGRSDFDENFHGYGGDDTLDGNGGDDTFVGGTGDDTLYGNAGSDTYVWATGDGNDIIDENDSGHGDIDTLVMSDVVAADVTLTRDNGSQTLHIAIASAAGTEIIDVRTQFGNSSLMDGIESIVFADGEIWTYNDILAATAVEGTAGADTLSGISGYADNLFGLAGNDVLDGNAGDDSLYGGTGDDTLNGEAGSDTYIWATGDGSDLIDDNSASTSDVDRLLLIDLLLSDISFDIDAAQGSLEIYGPGQALIVTDKDTFDNPDNGDGIEQIIFADGETFEVDSIFEVGTSASQTLIGNAFGQSIYGLGGSDTIYALAGDDTVWGGTGSDEVWLEDGDDIFYDLAEDGTSSDTAYGGYGNDTLFGAGGDDGLWGNQDTDELYGGDGDDHLDGGFQDDSLYGGAGNDMLYGGGDNGNDLLDGGEGDDELFGGNGEDFLKGRAGNDTLEGGGGADTLWGSDGDDLLLGGDGDDMIVGGSTDAGLDTLFGGSGDDELQGKDGDDTLVGGAGSDTLDGGDGNDVASYTDAASGVELYLEDLTSNTGDAAGDLFTSIESYEGSGFADTLVGSTGDDTLYGSAGDDSLDGSDGADVLFGGDGDDTIRGGTGNDSLFGGDGNDFLKGTADDDLLSGDEGNDELNGNSGEDTLLGGAGDDSLNGGGDDDTLTGGDGDDWLKGGSGADVFVFAGSFGVDVIDDFDASAVGEVIDLSSVSTITSFSDLQANHMSQSGSDVIIDAGSGNVITIEAVGLASLTTDQFVF